MPISGVTTYHNSLNLTGVLYLAGQNHTPLLTMMGGISGMNVWTTPSIEFSVGQSLDVGSASQPSISENASLTAPTATTYTRGQTTNTVQIFQETIALSDIAQAKGVGVVQADSTLLHSPSGALLNESPMEFQLQSTMRKMAKNLEFTMLQGVYQKAVDANTAAQSRGLLEASSVTAINASGSPLTTQMFDQLIGDMRGNGAIFEVPVVIVNARLKSALSYLYGYQPQAYDVGGVNIESILTDHGQVGVVYDFQMPTDQLLVAEMSVLRLMAMPKMGYPPVYIEPLGKQGMADSWQVAAVLGLDHGPSQYHGKITNLLVS